MRTMWLLALVMVVIHPVWAVETGDLQAATGQSSQTQEARGGSLTAESITEGIPCSPVAAYWTGPPQAPGMPQGPELAIISTKIRPKDARLLLDGRLVGRTRYLDGTPGYLYLEPGSYHLEIQFDGYQTIAFDLNAEVGCRYDLKHRLERVRGSSKEKKAETGGKVKPFHRVFGPVEDGTKVVLRGTASGPDMKLREDLTTAAAGLGQSAPAAAALRLRVSPEGASISIDGKFVATGRELARMHGPLAISEGSHSIRVDAPGFESEKRIVEVPHGEVFEIVIELSPNRTR